MIGVIRKEKNGEKTMMNKIALPALALATTIGVASACEDADAGTAVGTPANYDDGRWHVSDPHPPLNARETPRGRVIRHLANGTEVYISKEHKQVGPWVYIYAECDDQVGWVARKLITCR
jgi:hypothetical protein